MLLLQVNLKELILRHSCALAWHEGAALGSLKTEDITTWGRGAMRGPCGLGAGCLGSGRLCAPRREQLPPMRELPGEFCIDSRLSCWLP